MRVSGLGCRVSGFGFRVWGGVSRIFGFRGCHRNRDSDKWGLLGFRISVSECRKDTARVSIRRHQLNLLCVYAHRVYGCGLAGSGV